MHFTFDTSGTYACFISGTTNKASLTIRAGSCKDEFAEAGEGNVQLTFTFSWSIVIQKLVDCYKEDVFIGRCSGRYVIDCSVVDTSVGIFSMSTINDLSAVNITIMSFSETTAGTYSCSKENNLQRMFICLNPTVPLMSVTLQPLAAVVYLIYSVQSTFTCITSSTRPATNLYWFVGERNITDIANFTYSSDVSTSTLRYTPSSHSTERLSCVASYVYKNTNVTLSKVTEMQIQFPVSKPNITMNGTAVSDTVNVLEGTPVEFKCSSSSFPPPSYGWNFPGGSTDGSVVILHFNRTFTGETISCVTSNTYFTLNGTFTTRTTTLGASVKVNVLLLPDAPMFVCVGPVTQDAMTIRWQPGFSGSYEQSIVIKYRERHDSNWLEVRVPKQGFNSSYTLVGLTPGTTYELKMFTENPVGQSDGTDVITATTLIQSNDDCTCTTSVVGATLGGSIGGGFLSLFAQNLICRLRKRLAKKDQYSSNSQYNDLRQQPTNMDISTPATVTHSDYRQGVAYETLAVTPGHEYSSISRETSTMSHRNSDYSPNGDFDNHETTNRNDDNTYDNSESM